MDRHTEKQPRQIDGCVVDIQTNRQAERQIEGWTYRQIDIHKDRQKDLHSN